MGGWEEGGLPGNSRIQVIGCSDVGLARQSNEDNFLILDLAARIVGEPARTFDLSLTERGMLMLVTDGMGGRNAGEVASRIVVDTFRNELINRENRLAGCESLAEITRKANWAIWSRSQRNPAEQGMGATLTAVMVEANKAHIAQVGDSRAYVVRDGKIFRLTKDQSMVQTLIDSGIIKSDEADQHPYRHVVLQSLGAEPTVYPVTSTIDLYDGDYLLVCTDGLSNMVKDAALQEIILMAPGVESGCRALIDTANNLGGKDNITVILAALDYSMAAEMAEADFGTRTHSYFTPSTAISGAASPAEKPAEKIENEHRALDINDLEPHLERVDTPFPVVLHSEQEFKLPVAPKSRDSILIIDSDPERLLTFEFILKPSYEVMGATDGEEGLAKAITEHPRMIIASVELSKISGINLCQTLKSNDRLRNIPLVLISSRQTDRDQLIDGLSMGADEYLFFPVDERELILRVKPHIERAKLLETLRYEHALNEASNIQLHIEMESVARSRQDIFQNILDASSDGILILDLAGWVTAVNRSFELFHGIDKEQIVGFGYRALLKKIQHIYEEPEQQLHRFIELLEGLEMTAEDEVGLRGKRFAMTGVRRYSAPVRDEGGKIYGRFFIFRNLITHQSKEQNND
jgi:PPM family protein phosphatase